MVVSMLLDELTGLIGMRHSKILDIHSYQDKLRKATFMSKTRIRMLIDTKSLWSHYYALGFINSPDVYIPHCSWELLLDRI